jgi:serine/threonine protein kinase
LKEIASALGKLHDNRIIYLDIKLSNIVIDESMKSFRFIDYGCCHELPGADTEIIYKIPVCGT